jgi:hypothetical protein
MRIVFERRASAILFNLLRSRPDDRPFVLPANVCPIVPLTFLKGKRKALYIDIDPEDLVMRRSRLLDLARGRERLGGVLFVRTYGAEQNEEPFFAELKSLDPGLLLVDDRCLCRPDCDGESLCPSADVTLYSTGRAKYVDLGFGGFAHLRPGVPYRRHEAAYDPSALERATQNYKSAKAAGSRFADTEREWLDLSAPPTSWDLHARRLRTECDEADRHKTEINRIYRAGLPEEIQLPAHFQGWRFHVRIPGAPEFLRTLFEAGLFASRHYASVGGIFCDESFPEAERLHSTIVNLFNDAAYDKDRAGRTAALLMRYLGGAGK